MLITDFVINDDTLVHFEFFKLFNGKVVENPRAKQLAEPGRNLRICITMDRFIGVLDGPC